MSSLQEPLQPTRSWGRFVRGSAAPVLPVRATRRVRKTRGPDLGLCEILFLVLTGLWILAILFTDDGIADAWRDTDWSGPASSETFHAARRDGLSQDISHGRR